MATEMKTKADVWFHGHRLHPSNANIQYSKMAIHPSNTNIQYSKMANLMIDSMVIGSVLPRLTSTILNGGS